jgi:regulator of protease activity HflC (stomatin/prohibitin superfamily)
LITKRAEVKIQIRKELETRLQGRYIVVDEFSIVDFKFSPEYTAAIEAKQVAEQQVKTEQNNLEKQQLIAEQQLAFKRVEAEALRLQKEQVTPELIELRKVEVQLKMAEKWNGAYPITYMSMASGTVPLLNIPAVS